MACFLVPAGEAIVTTIVTKVIESRTKAADPEMHESTASPHKPVIVPKLKWLNNMLWGGSALLMFEHIWHGEVVPWFPFLTAAADPADTVRLHPLDQRSIHAALKDQIFDQMSDFIVCKGSDRSCPHAKAFSKATHDIVFSAAFPCLKLPCRADASFARVRMISAPSLRASDTA